MRAKRSHAAIRDRVHEAGLQPLSTVTVDQLAVDGRTTSANDDDHWLDGAVDPKANSIDDTSSTTYCLPSMTLVISVQSSTKMAPDSRPFHTDCCSDLPGRPRDCVRSIRNRPTAIRIIRSVVTVCR